MKKKVALDLMQPKRLTYRLPHDMILNENNVVKIYASGYSRIPVYRKDVNRQAICGILITKQLIVVNPDDGRPLNTLPLYTPTVVSPSTTLVDLLNILQTGGGGMKNSHMALVCAKPTEAVIALSRGQPIPEGAGWMGIVTLEDVLEALLQERIYDEFDNEASNLARKVWKIWTRYKTRKKKHASSKIWKKGTGSTGVVQPPTIREGSVSSGGVGSDEAPPSAVQLRVEIPAGGVSERAEAAIAAATAAVLEEGGSAAATTVDETTALLPPGQRYK